MKLNLPDTTLFTSDTHIDHGWAAIRRGYDSTEAMNADLVARWNAQVRPDDTVVHIGDLCWHKRSIKCFLPQLNGQIILVMGNHDRSYEREYQKHGVFTPLMLTAKIGELRIECCHFPLWSWDRMKYGAWHLHGHQHGTPTGIPGKIHDVGVDNNDLRLLTLKDLSSIMEDRPVRDHHEM